MRREREKSAVGNNPSSFLCLLLLVALLATRTVHSSPQRDAYAFVHTFDRLKCYFGQTNNQRTDLCIFGEARCSGEGKGDGSQASIAGYFICRDIDQAQSHLCSPAPESYSILDESIQSLAAANFSKGIDVADVEVVAAHVVKPGYRVAISTPPIGIDSAAEWWTEKGVDDSRDAENILYIGSSNWIDKPPGVLDLAHDALRLAKASSRLGIDPAHDIEQVVEEAKKRLKLLKGADLRGRTSADAAFCFALAGVECNTLFEHFGIVAEKELTRFGPRASCKPNQICQMVEKLAAAGIQRPELQKIASQILTDKGHEDLASKLGDTNFGFFTDMPLLWLWRFSAKQSKIVPSQMNAVNSQESLDWYQLYKDPSRPLVIDLGSGMGVSLLGLATTKSTTSGFVDIDWSSTNYLGVERNPTLAGFARGIASRWGLTGILQFVSAPVESLMKSVIGTYPGSTVLVIVSIPTPYRLQPNDGATDVEPAGNLQLPDEKSGGFMVTSKLLKDIACALQEEQGYLFFQSNSEDVAVHMRDEAEAVASFIAIDVPAPVLTLKDIQGRLTWRTIKLIENGGKRAIGPAWSKERLLPPTAKSETEVSCFVDGNPVHSCILRQSTVR